MRSRLIASLAGVVLVASGLAACGGGSGGTSTSSAASAGQQQGAQRRGFLSDPKVEACLKKQGVTVPSFGRRGNGSPSSGGSGQPPSGGSGQPPSGGRRRNGDPAQFAKLRQALQKCGVTLPDRGQNGPPPAGSTNSGTTAS